MLQWAALACTAATHAAQARVPPGTAICPTFPEPAANPESDRHHVQAPPAALFPRGRTRFSGYRGGCDAAALASYRASGLGDILWPQYPILNQNDAALEACLQRVADAGLAMVDVSNYVPGDTDVCDGSPPASSSVCEYHLPPGKAAIATRVLGDSFTGMDNGEQDGRWVGRYSKTLAGGGGAPSRLASMLHFERHFRRLGDDLGNKLMALNSLYYPHYFARAGLYTGLAAETAQGLPNAQLFYAFLRGAMKQFATLLWGNVSVYNRFGFKKCDKSGCSAAGTSLALMKRLMLAQLVYGVSIFGLEAYLEDGWALTPMGKMQKAAHAMPRWNPKSAAAHGSGPGSVASGAHAPAFAFPPPCNRGQMWAEGVAHCAAGSVCASACTTSTCGCAAPCSDCPCCPACNATVNCDDCCVAAPAVPTPPAATPASPTPPPTPPTPVPEPCTFLSTVAIVLDVESGWAPPRQLYSADLFRVWGTTAYDRADHFTHGLFDLFYPGYADSSWFHDEAGFSAPTPHGDVVDVLQTDAPRWLLRRYALLLLAGGATRSGLQGAELAANVEDAVAGHGVTAVLAADTVRALAAASRSSPARDTILGITIAASSTRVPAGASVTCEYGGATTTTVQTLPFNAAALTAAAGPAAAAGAVVEPLCTLDDGGAAVAMRVRFGSGGSLVVLATDGVSADADPRVQLPIESAVDEHLPTPFPLVAFVRSLLGQIAEHEATTIRATSAAGEAVTSSATCRRGPGEYTVLVTNPHTSQVAFNGSVAAAAGAAGGGGTAAAAAAAAATAFGAFASGVGTITAVAEVALDRSEEACRPGFLPQGFENASLGESGDTTVAGVDSRLFDVTVGEEDARIVETTPALPRGTRHVALPLPLGALGGGGGDGADALVDQVRQRPTFFHHFDAAVVDWRWVEAAEPAALARAEAWAALQGPLQLVVDFSSGINLYPDLRLVRNSVGEYNASMARIEAVLDKMAAALPTTARDAVLQFHDPPENYYSEAQCAADFRAAAVALDVFAGARNLTLHLRVSPFKPPRSLRDAGNFTAGLRSWRVGASVAALLARGVTTADGLARALADAGVEAERVGMWFVGAPLFDPLVPATWLSSRGRIADNATAAAAARVLVGAAPADGSAIAVLDAALGGDDGAASFSQLVDAEFYEVSALEAGSAVIRRRA